MSNLADLFDRNLLIVIVFTILSTITATLLPGIVVIALTLFQRMRRKPVTLPALLGPLFGYELIRLARSGVMQRLRVLYSLILLVGLLVVYLQSFSEYNVIDLLSGKAEIALDRSSAFGERYFSTFIMVQLGVLTLLTPVFAAGTITNERDRGTLDYLRASLLSSREIISAKYAARIVFLFSIIATGFPILALTMFFGGVSGPHLIASFAVAITSTLSLSAFSLWQATRCDTLRQTLFHSYTFVGVQTFIGTCCVFFGGMIISPFTLTIMVFNDTNSFLFGSGTIMTYVATFVVFHGLVALVLTFLAIGNIRVQAIKQPKTPRSMPKLATALEPQKKSVKVAPDPEIRPRTTRKPRGFQVERLKGDADPLLWKERYFSARLPIEEQQVLKGFGFAIGGGYLIFSLLGLLIYIINQIVNGQSVSAVINPVLRVTLMLSAIVFPFFSGLRATGVVGRERQKLTLESLLTMPVERSHILRCKWLASVLWTKPWLIVVAVIAVLSLISLSVHPVGLVVSLALFAGFLPFAVSFGIWLSIRCNTVLKATTWYLVVLIGITLVPLMLATLIKAALQLILPRDLADVSATFLQYFSIPYAMWQTNLGFEHVRETPGLLLVSLIAGLLVAAIYGLLARTFWRRAVTLFELEGRE